MVRRAIADLCVAAITEEEVLFARLMPLLNRIQGLQET
jgi:hypothetical protein